MMRVPSSCGGKSGPTQQPCRLADVGVPERLQECRGRLTAAPVPPCQLSQQATAECPWRARDSVIALGADWDYGWRSSAVRYSTEDRTAATIRMLHRLSYQSHGVRQMSIADREWRRSGTAHPDQFSHQIASRDGGDRVTGGRSNWMKRCRCSSWRYRQAKLSRRRLPYLPVTTLSTVVARPKQSDR